MHAVALQTRAESGPDRFPVATLAAQHNVMPGKLDPETIPQPLDRLLERLDFEPADPAGPVVDEVTLVST